MNEWNSGQQWCRRDRERQRGGGEGGIKERDGEREGEVKRRRGDFNTIGRSTTGQG